MFHFGFGLIGLAITIALCIWVYNDAEERGMSGIGWALGVFFVCIIFLPLYLIMRKPKIVR